MSTGAARATAAAEKKARQKRIELCTELLDLRIKNNTAFSRIEEIKSELKTMATDAGENYKETIAGKGYVNIYGEKEGAFKGDLPVLKAEPWKLLPERTRESLLKKGVVVVEAQYGGKFYGGVKVTLF